MAYTLQLKRHLNYENKAEALAGLQTYLTTTAAVGEPAIATYGGGQTIDAEKVLFGIKGAKGYTIFNADAIPSEVQSTLDAAIAAIKGGEDSAINDAYDTIKEIADALVKINGKGEGSIAKAKQDAENYADTQIDAAVKALDVTDAAVAKSFVTEVSETDGKIAVKRGAITSNNKTVVIGDDANGGIDLKANVDGTTIVVNEQSGVMSVASAALVQYVGQDAIAVSKEAEGKKTISLKLNAADKVLTQTTGGLLANINLTWDKTNGLKLTGKNGTEIATIPATDFIKNDMLENVTLEKNPVGQTAGTYLHFVFNTNAEKTDIYVNVTELIDIYTGSNGVQVSGKNISVVKDSSSESFLSIGDSGIKVSGVQTAINTAKEDVQKAIDKVESSVGLAEDGSHQKTTGNYTKDATTVVGEIAALDTQVKTNADAIAAETTRATGEEKRITDNVIGASKLEGDKSVMDVILENEETAQQAIEQLANAAGVLSGEQIKYTAPTVSGEFSSTTSIKDMLNKIDEKWNTIDCGSY